MVLPVLAKEINMVSVETALGFSPGTVPGNLVGRQIGCNRVEHSPMCCCVRLSSKELGQRNVGTVE